MTFVIGEASPVGLNIIFVIVAIPALALFWAIAAIVALIKLAFSIRRRLWRRSLALAVLPIIVLASSVAPVAAIRFCIRVGDTIHFGIMRQTYQSVVDAMPDRGGPKLKVFDWGGMVWASKGVVFDQSDEIALPRARQSIAWRASASGTELDCGGYSVTPMGGHFYLVDFPC